MTDREKAFVMNGLRNHIRTIAGDGSTKLANTDEKLVYVAKRLKIPEALLEETRKEQQAFLALVLFTGSEPVADDA